MKNLKALLTQDKEDVKIEKIEVQVEKAKARMDSYIASLKDFYLTEKEVRDNMIVRLATNTYFSIDDWYDQDSIVRSVEEKLNWAYAQKEILFSEDLKETAQASK